MPTLFPTTSMKPPSLAAAAQALPARAFTCEGLLQLTWAILAGAGVRPSRLRPDYRHW